MAKHVSVGSKPQNSWTVWFPEKGQSEEITPASSVLRDNQKYFQERLPRFEKNITSELIRIVRCGKRSDKEVPQAQEDLLSQLDLMPLEQLSVYVHSETERLQSADSDLKRKKSKGLHKAAAKFQQFAMTFDRFLTAYSGIVDIVQLADAQYGGVAFATLSLLFATVKLKATGEESIDSSMRQISDRLPDFKVYQRIYPDPSLGLMLAEAYKDVILFAREATDYFQSHGIVRYIRSVGKPLQFQLMEQVMRDNFNRIRLRCDTLLAQRIDVMQKREDTKLIIEMRKTLGLNNYRPEDMRKNLRDYRETLAVYFDNDRHRGKMNLSNFLMTPGGKDWESKGSLLLVLFGSNEVGVGTVSHSWLSPVAVDLVETLFDSNQTVAYDICTKSSTLVGVMSRLIYQLLERNPAIIRRGDNLQDIESQLSWEGNGSDKVRALRTALLQIINLHNNRVFIVLNRPDLCEQESQAEYIETMLSLVKDVKTELKIMVVQRSEIWDIEKRKNEIDIRGMDPKMLRTVRMNQCRL